MARFTAVVLALSLFTAPGHARGMRGSFTKHTTSVAGVGKRDWYLYVPARPMKRRPLVIFLHGCIQTALQAVEATRLNELADRAGFAVVYPQQNVTSPQSAPLVDGNGLGCWNWFLPGDQTRDLGEPAIIAAITRAAMTIVRADHNRVYVSGVSAGADMTVTLAASYPDLYASAAAVAGCAYATCADESGQLAYQQMGARKRPVPMLVEQGTADTLNVFGMGAGLVEGWLGTIGLAEGAQLSRTPAKNTNYELDQTPSPGSGDMCVRNDNYPCPGGVIGFKNSYPYTVQQYADTKGCDVLDFWIIHGMEHAYPHSPPTTVYSDPLGPDITSAIWSFFAAHPRGACPKP